MKAWRVYGVGDIRLDEVPRPEVRPGCVALRVRMVQLSVTEIQMLLQGDSLGGEEWEERCKQEGPLQIFGHEFCGEVVAVGEGAASLQVGDRVFWGRRNSCGRCALCVAGHGAFCQRGLQQAGGIPSCLAEYAVVAEGLLVKVPDSVTDSETTALQPLTGALAAITAADIRIGDVVAVLGQGVMGLNCLQMARYCGASRIIGLDVRAEALALSRELGADLVVDARENDPAAAIMEATGGVGADVVFECAGGSARFGLSGTTTLSVANRAVREGGRVILVGQHEPGTSVDLKLLRRAQYRAPVPASQKETTWAVRLLASKRVRLAPLVTHVLEGIEEVPRAIEMTANKRKYGVVNPVQVMFV